MRIIGIIVTGIFVLAVIASFTHQSTPVARKASEDLPLYQMNQQFSVGYWTYTINDEGARGWIGDLDRIRRADSGNWVLVDLTVRNDDTTASSRPVIVLVDDLGREFSETETFENGQLSQLQELNPGVSKRGLIFFDAPRVSAYRLKVSGGYTSGVYALVNLMAATKPPATPAQAQAPPVQANIPAVQVPSEATRDAQPVQAPETSAQAPADTPPPPEAVQVPPAQPVQAPSPAEVPPSDVLTLTVIKTKVVQHIDPQGHSMLFAKAYRKGSPDDKFSLICHTAKPSCTGLQEGEDYNARILRAGDPNYAYGDLKDAVIVRIDNAVFALMREKKVPEQ